MWNVDFGFIKYLSLYFVTIISGIFLSKELEELQNHTCELKNELQSIEEYEKALGEHVKRIEAKLEAQELDVRVKKMRDAITKTYLTLWFSSEGANPTSVVMRLQEIGFKPTKGKHDFVYDWG